MTWMNRELESNIKEILATKHRRKIWICALIVMIVIVVFCTDYALTLPAITMGNKAYCGIEEHTHTDACYTVQKIPKLMYTCPSEQDADFILHQHDNYCYNDAGQLICALAERSEHTHTQECYDDSGALICVKPEIVAHAHNESCYDEDGILICGLPQIVAHQHSEDCRVAVTKKTQICTPEPNAIHHHDEQCYDSLGNLVCTLPEQEGHVHSEACYAEEKKQICQLEESPGHTHTKECYAESSTLTCGQEESPGHTHTEECYDENGNLVCGKEESSGHTHTQECYTKGTTLICGQEESPGHTHTEECYAIEKVLVCQQQESVPHQHTAECFEETVVTEDVPVLTCNMQEHTHTDACFIEPEALTFTYTDENMEGVITLPWSKELPTDLSCTVVKLDGTESDYNEMYQSVTQAVTTDSSILSDMDLYQLEWYSDGKPYTLPEGLTSDVELTTTEDIASGESLNGLVLMEQGASNELDSAPESTEEVSAIAENEPSTPDASAQGYPLQLFSAEEPTGADKIEEATEGEYTATVVPVESGSISLRLANTNTFALARTSTIVSGYYYKRVDSLDEIRQYYNSGYTEKYVIVYANSVALAFGTDTLYVAPVEIQPVKGYENKDYFRIAYIYQDKYKDENGNTIYGYTGDKQFSNPIDYKARHWQIKPHPNNSSAFYIWENEDINDELWTSDWWNNNQIYLDHDDVTNTWRIHGTSYYMAYSEDSKKAQNIKDTWYLAQTNMLIFRYVGGEREIQDDIKESGSIEESMPTPASKPEYEDYRAVTASKDGAVSEQDVPVPGATMTYASDPATAAIEGELGSKTKTETGTELYNLQKKNDGRMLTDKSVVYGADDYGATEIASFGKYETGDFSVTLSALGQEWMVTDTVDVTAPLDVVYVLDISNSMNSNEAGSQRWMKAMNTINLSMKNVLERSSQNRVGLVAFSNASKQILPLDRYIPDAQGEFLELNTKGYNLQTATGLQYAGDSTAAIRANGTVPTYQFEFTGSWDKTYTQLGIQEAYDTFFEMAELSPEYLTFKVGDEVYSRQPIIILITDGDPTLCTYNYMYPKNGPSYGQGGSYGVEGYYTILSANYFKNLTSILYQRKAGFFTIGVSCTDNYTQTILAPTAERVAACANSTDTAKEKQLYNLLENVSGASGGVFTYLIKPQNELEYSLNIPGIGYNTPVIRGMYNPYTGNYNYCDKAWFGTLTEQNMNDIFTDILDRVQMVNDYNFLLQEGTDLVMTDYIGDGMAVKGVPVLRFYGKNYAADANPETGSDGYGNSYTIYRWTQTAQRLPSDSKESEGTAVSLKGISAIVITAPDGNQTVIFTVPEDTIPTYYPDLYKTFYYEELPIRLIYRVGLSDSELAQLQGISGGIDERHYYTSLYNEENGEAMTTASFIPDVSNIYYNANPSNETIKTQNTSATSSYSFKESVDTGTGTVVQSLGNNGTLTIQREAVLDLTVKKEWASGTTPTDSVSVMLCVAGTQQNIDGTNPQNGVWEVGQVELNADNNWTYTWNKLPMNETKGSYRYTYTNYYIAEMDNTGYIITYQDGGGNQLTEQSIQVNSVSGEKLDINAVPGDDGMVLIINEKSYVLPKTGGQGAYWYTLGGATLMLTVGALYMFNKCRPRYRDKGGER